MNSQDLRTALIEELVSVAPDIEPETLDPGAHLQDDLGLDSMDFLNLVAALHRRLGLSIPEADYPRLATLDSAVAYLAAELGR